MNKPKLKLQSEMDPQNKTGVLSHRNRFKREPYSNRCHAHGWNECRTPMISTCTSSTVSMECD